MPPRTPTAPEKRRSRTGCLTCRTRRRKCDERRPQCENCEAKGLSCRYGANITFVEPNATVPLEPSRDKSYPRIKFVGNGSSTSVGSLSPTAPPTFSAELDAEKDGHSPNDDISEGGLYGGRNLDPSGGNDKLPSGARDPAPPLFSLQASPGDGICLDSATVDFNRPMTAAMEIVTPSSRLEEVSDVSQLPGRVRRGSPGGTLSNTSTHGTSVITDHEVDLLRHYRYHIAPWLDLGDSKSTFGIAILIAAKEDYFLYHAILALAARQRRLRRVRPRRENVGDEASVQDCQNEEGSGSSSEQLPISSTTHLLLSLDKVLSSEPRSWSSIILKCVPTLRDVAPHAFGADVKAAVFWMLFRIG
jgi:hypothetical protein